MRGWGETPKQSIPNQSALVWAADCLLVCQKYFLSFISFFPISYPGLNKLNASAMNFHTPLRWQCSESFNSEVKKKTSPLARRYITYNKHNYIVRTN